MPTMNRTRKPAATTPACPQCKGSRQVTVRMVPGDPADTMPCPACAPPAPPAPASRPAPAPPRRFARWLPDAANGLRRLRLRVATRGGDWVAHDYELEQVAGGWRLYRLDVTASPPAVVVYAIHTDGPHGAWTCDCPSATRGGRQYVCKHVAGLRAALTALPF
jgi:hypothetical protein